MKLERSNSPSNEFIPGARHRAPDSFFARSRLLLFLVLSASIFSLGFARVLIIEDAVTAEEIARFDLLEGGAFSIGFVHSVNQSPVEETYEISNGKIWLASCLYYHFGAGVQTEVLPGQEWLTLPDGGMLIENIRLEIGELMYIVGTVSDHVLKIQEKTVSLRELCGRNRKILVRYQ